MLLHLLRRHLGVVPAHLAPTHRATIPHHMVAHHAPPATTHHSATPHSIHYLYSLLHHGLMLLHQFLALCRISGLLNLSHLCLHFLQVFLCLCHLLVKLLDAHRLLSRRGGVSVLLRKSEGGKSTAAKAREASLDAFMVHDPCRGWGQDMDCHFSI
ncbi:hypothetical protein D3C77_530280 [compost metagenome]